MTGDASDIDAALIDLIRRDGPFVDCVFAGELTGPDGVRLPAGAAPPRYVLVHSNRGVVRPDRFTGPARRRHKTFWIHSVGGSKRHAEAMAEFVLGRILNVRLVVPGWVCDPITHAASQPVEVNLAEKPAKYFGVDQFDVYASPAP